MKITPTEFRGLYVLSPTIFKDNRGYFMESFNILDFNSQIKLPSNFVQDNESQSKKMVLRGMHYQKGDFAQSKLVRVITGSVLDVVVDIRPKSKTFGKHFSIVLDNIEKKQLFIPKGFAHGFLTLSDNTIFSYKCDNFYNKNVEGGINPFDTDLNIDWGFKQDELILSDKDKMNGPFINLDDDEDN